ncbi:MAG: hypothetical protein IIA45_09660 [Bacteroidetes bacterium]|nr:hypothetical protein [Bacteroidota bacterium]
MKIVISFIALLLPIICLGQIPRGTVKIEKRIATEFDKGDTLKHKIRYYYYDSLNNELFFDSFSRSMLKEEGSRFRVVTDEPEKYVQALINSDGDTLDYVIYLYDEDGNRTHNFQIDINGDTLNAQKRTYDKSGNWIKLYNRNEDNSSYYLSMEQKYDAENNVTESKTFNKENKLVRLEKFKYSYSKDGSKIIVTNYNYVNKKGYVKQYKSIIKGNTEKTNYYYSRDGYNYGIKLRTVKGGYSIEEYYDDGTLKSKELYDNKKKLTASIYIFWETIKSP